jgi:hypothetical protein
MIKIRPASDFDIFENWPSYWPDKEHFANQHKVRREQRDELYELLARRATEREMERFLGANPEVLALVTFMYSTGHHAAWIYPKAHIRAPGGVSSGLIPDYVLAGANSGGVSWFLLELKSPGHKAFTKKDANVYLSSEANRGICQLLNYIDVASRSQGHLRDEMKLAGFREPRGILLIGTEDETQDEDIRSFKAAWNRMHPTLEIRSYNSLLRVVDRKLQDFKQKWPDKLPS